MYQISSRKKIFLLTTFLTFLFVDYRFDLRTTAKMIFYDLYLGTLGLPSYLCSKIQKSQKQNSHIRRGFNRYTNAKLYDLKIIKPSSNNRLLYKAQVDPSGTCYVIDVDNIVFGKVNKIFGKVVEVIPYYSEDFSSLVFLEETEIFGLLISSGSNFFVQLPRDLEPFANQINVLLSYDFNPTPFRIGVINPANQSFNQLQGKFLSKKSTPIYLKLVCK